MLWWIAETTLVAAALAAVAALAPRLRPLGPAARHALWLIVLVKLMIPPVVSWPWPVFAPPPFDRTPRGLVSALEGGELDRDGSEPVAVETSPPATVGAGEGAHLRASLPSPRRSMRPDAATLRRCVFVVWLAVSATLAAGQILRIVKFRGRLRGAVPAPDWLVGEAKRVGERIGVGAPEVCVVPGLGVPLLWCLGRPRLLLPARLIGTLGIERWRGVLAHELAHLRRGDHRVRLLALVAGWIWWWNPLYWIARRRIDAEAELACDAWVVWTLPDDRIVYAETLLDICASLSNSPAMTPSRTPAPALGITGSGRLFERRLTMILHDRVPCRLTLPGLFGAGLLVLLALPSWTVAEAPANRDRPVAVTDEGALITPPTPAAGLEVALSDVDDDDDPDKPAKKPPKAKVVKPRKTEKETTAPRDGKGKGKIEIDVSALEKAFGPDSEFVKKLEKLGPELEELGKVMEQKFGPGSEFETKMKELGERMEQKFGPGSEFETKMKELGERMEKKFGPGSDFEKRFKEKIEERGKGLDERERRVIEEIEKRGQNLPLPSAKKKPTSRPTPEPSPRPSARTESSRERRIKDLESRINGLMRELKQLKAEDGGDDDEPSADAVKR